MANITAGALIELAPAFKGLPNNAIELFTSKGRLINLSRGQALFNEGSYCDDYILVLDGIVCVRKLSNEGHEIAIQRFSKGDQCDITNSCLLSEQRYPVKAICETDTQILLLPKNEFHTLLKECPEFKQLIFKNIDSGMSALLNLIREIAFEEMDHRLANTLIKRSKNDLLIRVTHQDLATDLGTAREVISRLLKDFERKGLVKLRRGKIEILDPEQLSRV